MSDHSDMQPWTNECVPNKPRSHFSAGRHVGKPSLRKKDTQNKNEQAKRTKSISFWNMMRILFCYVFGWNTVYVSIRKVICIQLRPSWLEIKYSWDETKWIMRGCRYNKGDIRMVQFSSYHVFAFSLSLYSYEDFNLVCHRQEQILSRVTFFFFFEQRRCETRFNWKKVDKWNQMNGN